jgi:uncharacterized protein (DUF1778 family)
MGFVRRLITIPPEIEQQIKEAAKAENTNFSAFLRESALERINKNDKTLAA